MRLALSHQAGLLTAIRVPSEQEEAVRDLVRTRADLVDDCKRMMQRVGALLQRHGRVWRAPRWTCQHRAWLDRQSFTEPALQAALRTYLAALDTRDAELAVLETQLRGCWASVDPLASMVRQLGCYRGIAELTALTLAAEVADFRRFASAPAFMGFTGLTPSEYSSGARTRRGAITKAGARARPGPENAGKILVLLTAAGPGRPPCSFSAYRLVASWKGLAAAAPAAQQVGDQVLCPGNIATAGREWIGTVTRLGSIYHGELRRLLDRAPYPMPAASRA